jgi:hypothetical protein
MKGHFKKCEVKLQEHSNHIAGKSGNFLKTGKTCKAVSEQGKIDCINLNFLNHEKKRN